MTLVNIDLRNQGYETSPGDRVAFYSLLVREGDFGTISTAPVEVELTDGKASVDLAPGPVGVQIIAKQVADTRVKIGEVPPSGPTTLNAVMMVAPAYTPALQKMMVAAVERAKELALGEVDSEVAKAVNGEVGAFKLKADQALAKSNAAEAKAGTSLAKSSIAESAAGNAVNRVTQLESAVGLGVGDLADGQAANLISQRDTLTRAATNDVVTGTTGIYPVELFGAVGDGETDDTAAWNAAVDYVHARGGGTVSGSPDAVYMIRAEAGTSIYNDFGGIGMKSGVNIHLPEGSVLRAFPVTTPVSKILRFTDKENIRVYGPGTVDGNRQNAIVTTGEHGHGLAVNGGRNITIEGIRVINCWGDGINIHKPAHADDTPASNVTVRGVICDNNRRQGLTISSVIGMIVEDSTFSNTNGIAPMAGIDIEISTNGAVIFDVTVRRNRFLNNARCGLLAWESGGVGYRNITIENNVFDGNGGGQYAQMRVESGGNAVTIRGNIFNNTPSGSNALDMRGPSRGGIVSGNTLDGDLSTGALGQVGGHPLGLTITGNTFSPGQIRLTAQKDFTISGNFFEPGVGKSAILFTGSAAFMGAIVDNVFQGGLHGIDLRGETSPPSHITISGNDFQHTDGSGIKLLGESMRITGNTFRGCCLKADDAVIDAPAHWKGIAGSIIKGNFFYQAPHTGTVAENVPLYTFRSSPALINVSYLDNHRLPGTWLAFPADQATGNGTILAANGVIPARPTAYRPMAVPVGTQFFDTTLGKPIIYNGSSWRNQDGTPLA